MSGPIVNTNSQTSSTDAADERTLPLGESENAENTENPNKRASILEDQGYTLGHQVGSGCYAKVKVSFFNNLQKQFFYMFGLRLRLVPNNKN